MKKSLFMFLCAGTVAFSACNKTEKTESDTATVIENETTNGTADTEAMYRDRAEKTARQMAADLKLESDTALQAKARTVYYTRATRRNEIRTKYTTDTTGMNKEMRNVDMETDREFQSILKPDQYSTFQTNRSTYYGGFDDSEMMDANSDSMSGSSSASSNSETGPNGETMGAGSTVRTKTEKDGDTKTEIEGPNGQMKIKTDANGKTKVKTKEKK